MSENLNDAASPRIQHHDINTFTSNASKVVAKADSSWETYYGRQRARSHEYTITEVEKILGSTSLAAKQKLSRDFFVQDGFYKRTLLYYATLLKYSGILIPNPSFGKKLSTPHILKRYNLAVNFLDKVPLEEIFTRMTLNALIDGCYYGVIGNMDKSELTIIDLPAKYCDSTVKDLYGNDIVDFNVAYFDTIFDKTTREQALSVYPKAISSYYRKWSKGRVTSSWMRVPSDIGLCFPFFDSNVPLFLAMIPAIMKYDDAVDTELDRELEEIRKLIIQKIPHLNDGTLVFEPEEALEMHRGAVNMLRGNKHLSVMTTYADVDSIVSKTSAESVSGTLESVRQNIYSEAGATSQLFAPTGSAALSTSINNDMSMMMILAKKYENRITKIINSLFSNSNITFKYTILPITYYNQSEYISEGLKMAALGYSFMAPAIAQGFTQNDLVNIKTLENDVLNLGDYLIPLSSSYNSSASSESSSSNGSAAAPIDEGGATALAEEDKSEKTLENEQSLDNQGGS